MQILVTRPEPDSLKLKGILEARGFSGVAAPLMRFHSQGLALDQLEGVTGLIATSRNGLRALVGTEALEYARQLTVFTVGGATAEEARRMGFKRIVKGPGTAAALGPLIASMIDPVEEVLLHLAGERLAFDLAGELAQLGVRVVSETVYRMVPADRLHPDIAAAISRGAIDAVMLMSPDTARIWVRLVEHHGIAPAAREMLHLCLSEAISRRLAPLSPARVEIARQATLEGMLALLDDDGGKSSKSGFNPG